MRQLRPLCTSTRSLAIALGLALVAGPAAAKDEPLQHCRLTDDSGRFEVRVEVDGDSGKDVQKDALLEIEFVGPLSLPLENPLIDLDWTGDLEGVPVAGVVSRTKSSGRRLEMTPGPSASNDVAQDALVRADGLLDCVDLDQIALFDEEMSGRFRKRDPDELKRLTWKAKFVAFGSPRSGGGCGQPSGNLTQAEGRAKIMLDEVVLERALPDCGPGDAPGNDDFDAAVDLTGEINAVEGSTVCATSEGGEPRHAGARARKSIWYRWTAAEDARAKVLTVDNGFDTVVGVYQGDSVDALTKVASNDDAKEADDGESKASFDALAGVEYRIAVDGFGEACPAAREGAVSVLIKTTASAEEPEAP